ncbi:diguanylate cyclase domain-containing protein [Deinococcus rufus]|uniref:Diguanylate cyclase domain-containing protein n=1 Tax=Deinococcus rufus TaxID=2136097 RepID=A0ABV7ZBW2_9DEIO
MSTPDATGVPSQQRVLLRLRWAAIAALVCLGILCSAANLTLGRELVAARDETRSVDVAGRQRLLAQRIAWTAERVSASDAPLENGALREQLAETLSEFRRTEAQLRDPRSGINGGPFTPAIVAAAYGHATTDQIDRFVADAQTLLALPPAQAADVARIAASLGRRVDGPVLARLDEAVRARSAASAAYTDRIARQVQLVTAATLALLLGLFVLVVRPLERHTRAALRRAAHERDLAQSIAQSMGQGLAVTGPDGRYVYVNPAFAQLLGYGADTLPGTVAPAFPPGQHELTLTGADHRVPVLTSTVPHGTSAGPGTLTVVTDLRDVRAREAEMRASESQYRALASHFPQGAVILFDHDLRYLVADGAGLSAVGLSPAQMVGHTVRDIFPEQVVATIEPDHRAALMGVSTVREHTFLRRTYLVQTLPLPPQGGQPRGMMIVQDITNLIQARRDAELARESALTLATLTRSLQAAASIQEVNERAVTLLQPAVGADWLRLASVRDGMLTDITGWGTPPPEVRSALFGGVPVFADPLWAEVAHLPVYVSGSAQPPSPALAAVPLPNKPERGVIVLLAGRAESRPWTTHQRALLEAGGRAVCSSWERVTLQSELRTSEAYARALLDVSALTDAGLTSDQLALQVVEVVARVSGVDWGALAVVRGDHAETVSAWYGPAGTSLGTSEIRSLRRGAGALWSAYDAHEATFVDDYPAHPDAVPSMVNHGVRSACWVPLARFNGGGYLLVATRHRPESPWSAADQALFAAAGRAVATALQRDAYLEALETSALTDSLTQLGNRRAFDAALDVLERRGERSGEPFGVLVIDLDGLKQVNDALGHAAGDVMLRSFAETLRRHFRVEDQVFRFGGDEFAVLLPGTTHEHAAAVRRRLNRAVSTMRAHGFPTFGASAGSTFYPTETSDVTALLDLADQRMYQDKQGKRVHRDHLH